jgi:sec-independent protein translocase protein TatA
VSIPEIVLLLVVALLVFGPKRLPEIGRQVGKGLREFKQSVTDADEDSRPDGELPTSHD